MDTTTLKHVTLDGVRIHLNTKERKLWINSQYVLFLNETSAFIIASMIDSCHSVPKSQVPAHIISKVLKKYSVSKSQAEQDFNTIIGIINSFARDDPPMNMVGLEIIKDENLTAPNRMDIAITYRCNNNCSHCYLSENKSDIELTEQQWKTVIDKLWDIGIPQVVFTGGEPFLRKSTLIKLAEYSKKFICGIITNGTLITPQIAAQLKKTELDWIQITLESSDPKIHDDMVGRSGAFDQTVNGIKNCVNADVPVSINATLTNKNHLGLKNLIDYARDNLNITHVSTNAIINAGRGIRAKLDLGVSEKILNETLKLAKQHADNIGVQLDWFLPTCYKNLNPMELGFGIRSCSACQVNMLASPEGTIHPCQSWTQAKLGNILTGDWSTIWHHPIADKARSYAYAPTECKECEYEKYCHGSCPLLYLNDPTNQTKEIKDRI